MVDDERHSRTIRRRTVLGAGLIGLGGAGFLAGKRASAQPASSGNLPFTAQTTEGPYYLELDLVRTDITEGLPGIPIDIVFTVLDEGSRPSGGARVDVWHCDAQGNYSGFVQPRSEGMLGRTFLRGSQFVEQDGRAVFRSIYPGWYPGRTTHIHFKVRSGEKANLTSQFFLPDALSEFLYTQMPSYQRKGLRDTLNSTDGIAIAAGSTVDGCVREGEGRYIVSLTVRVDGQAEPPIDRPPQPSQHPLSGLPQPGPIPLGGSERIAALSPDAPRRPGTFGPGRGNDDFKQVRRKPSGQ